MFPPYGCGALKNLGLKGLICGSCLPETDVEYSTNGSEYFVGDCLEDETRVRHLRDQNTTNYLDQN